MNLRTNKNRVSHSERAILRFSPGPKRGSANILPEKQCMVTSPRRALAPGCSHPSLFAATAAVALAAVIIVSPAHAKRADADVWIETWTASPQPIWDAEFAVPIN